MKIVSFIDEKAVVETRNPGMGEEHAEGAPKGCNPDGCSEHSSALQKSYPASGSVPFGLLHSALGTSLCCEWREYIPHPPPTKNYVAFGDPKKEQGVLPIANAGPLLDYSFFEQTCA